MATMLRLVVGFLSLCGLLGWGAMFLLIVGMSGFGSGRANPFVVFTLATPLAFFLLCFLSALRAFGPALLRAAIVVVVLLALPFFWYLMINGPDGIIGAVVLGGFLALWIAMCRQQFSGKQA